MKFKEKIFTLHVLVPEDNTAGIHSLQNALEVAAKNTMGAVMAACVDVVAGEAEDTSEPTDFVDGDNMSGDAYLPTDEEWNSIPPLLTTSPV